MNQKTNVRMSRDGKLIIVNLNGQTGFINANLLRYLLGVPYTKKDGTHISSETIVEIKRKAQSAYVQKIQSQKLESA